MNKTQVKVKNSKTINDFSTLLISNKSTNSIKGGIGPVTTVFVITEAIVDFSVKTWKY